MLLGYDKGRRSRGNIAAEVVQQPRRDVHAVGLRNGNVDLHLQASRTACSRCDSAASSSGSRACARRTGRAGGSGCISTITPSAPQAAAASASGVTRAARPAAWLGSTRTGRWVISCRAGTAARSSVPRVNVSNVRMPRSQSITRGLPPPEDTPR